MMIKKEEIGQECLLTNIWREDVEIDRSTTGGLLFISRVTPASLQLFIHSNNTMPFFKSHQMNSIILVIVTAVITRTYDTYTYIGEVTNNCYTNNRIESAISIVSGNENSSAIDNTNSKTQASPPIEFPCIEGNETGCHTFPIFRPIEEELEEFMKTQSDSVGANFVKLLREYLHSDPTWERARLDACYKARDLIKCFAGMKNYNLVSSDLRSERKKVKMPFYDGEDVVKKMSLLHMR